MNVDFTKAFNKQFEKLPRKRQEYVLKGEWLGYRSISAGGDLRLHFKMNQNNVLFVAVGSHSQLYK